MKVCPRVYLIGDGNLRVIRGDIMMCLSAFFIVTCEGVHGQLLIPWRKQRLAMHECVTNDEPGDYHGSLIVI